MGAQASMTAERTAGHTTLRPTTASVIHRRGSSSSSSSRLIIVPTTTCDSGISEDRPMSACSLENAHRFPSATPSRTVVAREPEEWATAGKVSRTVVAKEAAEREERAMGEREREREEWATAGKVSRTVVAKEAAEREERAMGEREREREEWATAGKVSRTVVAKEAAEREERAMGGREARTGAARGAARMGYPMERGLATEERDDGPRVRVTAGVAKDSTPSPRMEVGRVAKEETTGIV